MDTKSLIFRCSKICCLNCILTADNFVLYSNRDLNIRPFNNLDYFFFPMFFEFMIFTDVFLLIVSIPFYDRYEYVIRNSGFVISTVLLRLSLSTPKPYDLAIALVAIVYGLCVLGVFSYFTRVIGPFDDTRSVSDDESNGDSFVI